MLGRWYRAAAVVGAAICVLAAPAGALGAPHFGPAIPYPVAGDPWAIATGDFNRDGHADLSVGDFNSGMVSVLKNKGGGVFGAAHSYPSGGNPESIAVGRLDAGKDLDIAAGTTGDASVLFGAAGSTFSPFQQFGTYPGQQARGIAIADFNGDGKRDVVVSEDEKLLVLLLGDGHGGFKPQITTAFAPKSAGQLALGRINGDKRPDLAMASGGAKSVLVFTARKGSGGFKAPKRYPGPGECDGIAVGDINGDGRTDIADVGGPTGPKGGPHNPELGVLLQRKGGGFRPPRVTLLPGGYAADLALADLDRDGNLDAIVLRGNGKLAILPGLGNGRFGHRVSLSAGNDARQVVVARLNGDKRPDLAVTGGGQDNVSVLLAKG